MTMTATDTAALAADLRARHPAVFDRPLLARLVPWLAVGGTVLYLAYAWWFFAVGAVLSDGRWDRTGAYLADWVSYDVRPTLRFGAGGIDVTWPRFNPLGDDPSPDWIERRDAATVVVRIGAAVLTATPATVVVDHAGERLTVDLASGTPRAVGPVPAWALQKEDEVDATFGFAGSVEIKPTRIAVVHRFPGWANFLFDTRSPFFNRPAGEVLGLIVSGERIDPARSNLALAADNVWHNAEWQHGDVFAKLLQTVVMAFVGTALAVAVAAPMAFLAARNITPSRLANQATKRFFDFQRTIDGLIWALFFIRAFGPGPIPGIAAIAFTDVGSLGKLYAEALENIDDKQREGVKSVGAAPVAVQRYGVLPQVMPLFASQALYFWESNTRSATIIGAVGAGGIGLKLWEAMRTNSDWENVAYMVLLILIVVFVFDGVSNALRSRLMGKPAH